ncbi:unnamed protein product, partial [Choristocarpus tenellus]
MDLVRYRKRQQGCCTSILNVWDVPLVHHTSFYKWRPRLGALVSLWNLCKPEKEKRVKWWIKTVLSDQQKVSRVGFVMSHTHRRKRSGVLVDDILTGCMWTRSGFTSSKLVKVCTYTPLRTPQNSWAQNK